MAIDEEYIDEVERKIQQKKMYIIILIVSVFIVSFLFIGDIVHELSHIIVLKLLKCEYSFEWSITAFSGLSGSIQPYCNLESTEIMFFYVSGYLAHLLIGGVTWPFISRLDGFSEYVIGAIGSGILLSLMSSLHIKGDIINSIDLLGLPRITATGIYLITLLMATLIAVKIVKELERKKLGES